MSSGCRRTGCFMAGLCLRWPDCGSERTKDHGQVDKPGDPGARHHGAPDSRRVLDFARRMSGEDKAELIIIGMFLTAIILLFVVLPIVMVAVLP